VFLKAACTRNHSYNWEQISLLYIFQTQTAVLYCFYKIFWSDEMCKRAQKITAILWWGSFWANVNWISFTNSVPVIYSFLKWLIVSNRCKETKENERFYVGMVRTSWVIVSLVYCTLLYYHYIIVQQYTMCTTYSQKVQRFKSLKGFLG
jgi:hypothetical protein